LQRVAELRPDIVLADINMPRMDGVRFTEELRRTSPEVRVVILSVHQKAEYVQRVIRAGARGYVLKNHPRRVVQVWNPCMRETSITVRKSRKPRSRAWWRRRHHAERGLDQPARTRGLVKIASGLSNKEIAAKLGVSVRTIEPTANGSCANSTCTVWPP
jgi:DNA-binding NarL/FixJ family response regulator